MAQIVLLSTVNNLIEEMPINADSDSDNLSKVMYISQEMYIQSALGSNLYKKIKQLVFDDQIGESINLNYKKLLDEFIVSLLHRYTYYKSLRVQSNQLTDKGVQKRNGESSSFASDVNVHALRQDALNDAEFHEKLMINYICEGGTSKFPEYWNSEREDLLPKNGNTFNGIVYSGKNNISNKKRKW